MVKALVPIANGTEEIEAVTMANVLIRGGVDVTLASVADKCEIAGSRGLRIVANCLIADCLDTQWDLIALPGGLPGADNLRDCVVLIQLLRKQRDSGRLFAAICASPKVVLETHGLLDGYKATCYPAFHMKPEIEMKGANVVRSKNCLTADGPGTAMEFSLRLVEALTDKNNASKVAEGLLTSLEG